MSEYLHNNSVTIAGKLVSEPTLSHELYGEKFYEATISVARLSGMEDLLPICISEHLLTDDFHEGNFVAVAGQFRSYNKEVNEKSKLLLTVFVREVLPYDGSVNPNVLKLSGYLCKPPVYRTTPFNREICDLLLAVNRQYNKSDYIPCIVWGRNARFAGTLNVGDHINIVGRVQSRLYQKHFPDDTVVTRTAYEVSVSKIEMIKDDVEVSDPNADYDFDQRLNSTPLQRLDFNTSGRVERGLKSEQGFAPVHGFGAEEQEIGSTPEQEVTNTEQRLDTTSEHGFGATEHEAPTEQEPFDEANDVAAKKLAE